MTSGEIRQQFLDFFEHKQHKIVASAPIVNKNDPTLLFTNAGMNQFKDFFLGNKVPDVRRVADTQKCLRVSGKHNDLEEVGVDSYHHTMFEMLGNWSFGDYFKKEAIAWAWELLIDVYGLPQDRLYVTVFGGDESDNLEKDEEAANFWREVIPTERVLYFDRKDNFWEMGESGPCGPCSEIHVDLRSEADRANMPGKHLVNMDHPQVIEIWNLVFIQFNRKADSTLVELPEKHVDTGMGFERLCLAIQNKLSSYDTDVFMPLIKWVEQKTGKEYKGSYEATAKSDVAFRVIVDHIRACTTTIADGQLPSNTGAGYVIRRILRRAVRYYYTFLDHKAPMLNEMVALLGTQFGDVFPEIKAQESFISKIILEEEKSFLRTIEGGLKRISQLKIVDKVLSGEIAFELYDTYGFPIDLTRLIATDNGWTIDENGFTNALNSQKERSRADAKKQTGDWVELIKVDRTGFVGYDQLTKSDCRVVKYRTVVQKDKEIFQLILDETPFYAESGGQVGDKGELHFGSEVVKVLNTQKENDLHVHIVSKFPEDIESYTAAHVNEGLRSKTENNHTTTHLMHSALRQVLGKHVEQKGSLVNEKYLRFDFSHFEKMTESEIQEVEDIVNTKIRENVLKVEDRNVPISKARESGAMMLFGEKYGEHVRMVTFDPDYSVELCGGCHVNQTGQIGSFRIKSESAIAAGVRRIEAVTGEAAIRHSDLLIDELNDIKGQFKNPTNPSKQVANLIAENAELQKAITNYKLVESNRIQEELVNRFEQIGEINFLAKKLTDMDMESAKTLGYNLEKTVKNGVVLLGIDNGEKANLQLIINKDIVTDTLNAGQIIRQISKHIQGGGGGQPFFASAGGKNSEGLDKALLEAKEILSAL